jgi:hypothetical protein
VDYELRVVLEKVSVSSQEVVQRDTLKVYDKRSFEALSAVIYRPESIRTIDQHHREIERKSCVLSAKDDDLATMKTYLLNATRKQSSGYGGNSAGAWCQQLLVCHLEPGASLQTANLYFGLVSYWKEIPECQECCGRGV